MFATRTSYLFACNCNLAYLKRLSLEEKKHVSRRLYEEMAAHYRRQVTEGEKVWAPAMCAENRVAYA